MKQVLLVTLLLISSLAMAAGGKVRDANAAPLIYLFAHLGVDLQRIAYIGDEEDDIIAGVTDCGLFTLADRGPKTYTFVPRRTWEGESNE